MAKFCKKTVALNVDELLSHAIEYYNDGNLVKAEALSNQIMLSTKNHPNVLNLLGTIHFQTGRQESGFSFIQQAVLLQPNFIGAQFNLAKAYKVRGDIFNAEGVYKRVLELEPDHLLAHIDLVKILIDNFNLEEAMKYLRNFIEIHPDSEIVTSNMALVLVLCGELDNAEIYFRKALEIQKYNVLIHSNLLSCLQYNPEISDEQIFDEHCQWDELHGKPRAVQILPWLNTPLPNRVIRIGYVSPDLGRHPVGYFLSSVIASHNREKVRIYCYSDRIIEDELTGVIRLNADVWRPVEGLSDEKLAEIIRSDEIDILVDLAGHTRKNRLTLFAMKPAPIQVTWAGYVGTTGLSAMDYLLSDGRQSPEGAESKCVESIIRLPDCYVCYSPPDYAPAVGNLPALHNGYVTFGCFNNLAKITPQVVALWSELLKQLPDARLVIRTMPLRDPGVSARYLNLFNKNGITADRINLLPGVPHRDLLAEYNAIDIALDPFPYSGGLTTLEALWMGVPVITLGGSRFCSRHSVSHLSSVGLAELIATDQTHYLVIATSLARNREKLSKLRNTLRDRMSDSPLCDSQRFTYNLEKAFQGIWSRWCTEQIKVYVI